MEITSVFWQVTNLPAFRWKSLIESTFSPAANIESSSDKSNKTLRQDKNHWALVGKAYIPAKPVH